MFPRERTKLRFGLLPGRADQRLQAMPHAMHWMRWAFIGQLLGLSHWSAETSKQKMPWLLWRWLLSSRENIEMFRVSCLLAGKYFFIFTVWNRKFEDAMKYVQNVKTSLQAVLSADAATTWISRIIAVFSRPSHTKNATRPAPNAVDPLRISACRASATCKPLFNKSHIPFTALEPLSLHKRVLLSNGKCTRHRPGLYPPDAQLTNSKATKPIPFFIFKTLKTLINRLNPIQL